MDTMSEQDNLRRLLRNLWGEVVQTETSASLHCRREARRLGESPPASALLAVAQHADRAREALPRLAVLHDLPLGRGGALLGGMLSEMRERFVDHVVERERSYRGTLIGMRHGVDLFVLLERVVAQLQLSDFVSFCNEWLAVRTPLVAAVADQLAWFAMHSDVATGLARPLPLLDTLRRSHPPTRAETPTR